MSTDKTPKHIKLDERNHVERPLLDKTVVTLQYGGYLLWPLKKR